MAYYLVMQAHKPINDYYRITDEQKELYNRLLECITHQVESESRPLAIYPHISSAADIIDL